MNNQRVEELDQELHKGFAFTLALVWISSVVISIVILILLSQSWLLFMEGINQ